MEMVPAQPLFSKMLSKKLKGVKMEKKEERKTRRQKKGWNGRKQKE